jgi:hypothetical protein
MPGRNSACLLIPHRTDTALFFGTCAECFADSGRCCSHFWRLGKFPRRYLPRRRNLSAAGIIHRPSPCSSCRVNCRGVYHRPGHHPDLFYLYPTQEIAEPRGSPHAGVPAVAHTSTLARSDAHLTAGAGERECQKPEKHRRNRELNGADQLCARNRREIAFFQYALVMQFVPGDHECQRPHADFFSAGRAATHPGRLT